MSGGAKPPVERLTLFDLDNTLLGGDSDYGWAQFLIEQGAVDAEDYERRNAEFFADYKAGTAGYPRVSRVPAPTARRQRTGHAVRLA